MNKTINKTRWTPEQDRIAMQMRAAGSSMEDIGERFGRSGDSVRNRLRWVSMSIEERQELSRTRNRRKPMAEIEFHREETPFHVIEDRNRRALIERSLTASIFGDPEPGRSALCKREAAACTA